MKHIQDLVVIKKKWQRHPISFFPCWAIQLWTVVWLPPCVPFVAKFNAVLLPVMLYLQRKLIAFTLLCVHAKNVPKYYFHLFLMLHTHQILSKWNEEHKFGIPTAILGINCLCYGNFAADLSIATLYDFYYDSTSLFCSQS